MRKLLCFLSVLFYVGCNQAKKKVVVPEQPNILFIMSDDHTSQAWGIYGGPLADHVKNDHIQRLATEGAILENVFCTNSICTPSRASILTGQYSHRNGIYTLSEGLSPDSMNIAKSLQAAGYETAIVGKWHLKQKPNGFDYFKVLPGQGRYHNPKLKGAEDWEDGYQGGKEYSGFSSDVIGDLSVDWLKNRKKEKPFMLMTHFKATHEPFDYPERYENLYDGVEFPEPKSLYDFDPATNGRSFIGQKLWILGERWVNDSKKGEASQRYPGMPFSLEGLSKEEARKKTYQKFVRDFLRSGAAIDDNIGKLLDYLDESGLADNTIVIYTSDQGYFLGEHGFFDKRMIYEQALRMPFVIRYPKEIPKGSRIQEMILNLDFPALFADYAGIEKPAYISGKSFRNILKGKTDSRWRTQMYYRYWLHQEVRPAHFGIRNERYKLAFFYGQALNMPGTQNQTSTVPAWEFYDLKKDPGEDLNAIDDPAYQDIIAEMKVELEKLRERTGDQDKNFPIMEKILNEHWN